MTHNTSLKQDWSVFKNKQINHRQQSNDLNLVMNATSIFSEPGGASGKEFTCQCGRCKRLGFNPYCYLGVGSGNPLQSSCWENSMDRRAWGATVHRVTKSQTQWKWLSTYTCTIYGRGQWRESIVKGFFQWWTGEWEKLYRTKRKKKHLGVFRNCHKRRQLYNQL